jgi:hypothetical protein
VTARGNDRKDIYREGGDRFHCLELLSQLGEQFGARVHAYVLLDKHYHLLLETPEANLSRAMRAGRLRLAELGKLAGGLDYAVVSKAMARFAQRLGLDASLRKKITALEEQLSNDKT